MRPLIVVGDVNAELGQNVADTHDDYHAPNLDLPIAGDLSDFFVDWKLMLPATFRHLHASDRATHRNPALVLRRIDYVAVPAGWSTVIQSSFVDTFLDMISPGDDHFMPVVLLDGHFGTKDKCTRKGKDQRLTAKRVESSTPESQNQSWEALNRIHVPQWSYDVHMHQIFARPICPYCSGLFGARYSAQDQVLC